MLMWFEIIGIEKECSDNGPEEITLKEQREIKTRRVEKKSCWEHK